MSNEKWPPDHSITKGYPYDEVKSVSLYPPDKRFTDEIILDDADDSFVKIGEEKFKNKKLRELAMNLVDCTNALASAEGQISALLTEDPFVPEDFSFVSIAKPEGITDPPARIWGCKHDERYSLYRVPGTGYDWVLLRKREDNSFDEIPMYLPSHRIAYAAFTALRVKVEITQNEAELAPVTEQLNQNQ